MEEGHSILPYLHKGMSEHTEHMIGQQKGLWLYLFFYHKTGLLWS